MFQQQMEKSSLHTTELGFLQKPAGMNINDLAQHTRTLTREYT